MAIIQCSSCGFSRDVPEAQLPQGPVSVRCPSCKTSFTFPGPLPPAKSAPLPAGPPRVAPLPPPPAIDPALLAELAFDRPAPSPSSRRHGERHALLARLALVLLGLNAFWNARAFAAFLLSLPTRPWEGTTTATLEVDAFDFALVVLGTASCGAWLLQRLADVRSVSLEAAFRQSVRRLLPHSASELLEEALGAEARDAVSPAVLEALFWSAWAAAIAQVIWMAAVSAETVSLTLPWAQATAGLVALRGLAFSLAFVVAWRAWKLEQGSAPVALPGPLAGVEPLRVTLAIGLLAELLSMRGALTTMVSSGFGSLSFLPPRCWQGDAVALAPGNPNQLLWVLTLLLVATEPRLRASSDAPGLLADARRWSPRVGVALAVLLVVANCEQCALSQAGAWAQLLCAVAWMVFEGSTFLAFRQVVGGPARQSST